jgi:hypothetical protein
MTTNIQAHNPMKLFLLSFLLIFSSSLSMAQVWAPPGATWHYDWAQMWFSGYVEIQYTGDSVIEGKSCKILKKERHSYDWVNHIYETSLLGYEYTYMENNVVYYYRFGKFFKLYDFNASPTSSWEVAGWDQSSPCDSNGSIVTVNTGMTNINNYSFKYLAVSPGLNSDWGFSSDTIIERIGSLGYMFPEPGCVVDLSEGGQLRCYYDDSFGLFERGSSPSCDYITGVDKINMAGNLIKIYPVPANSVITLEIDKRKKGKTKIEIFDIFGNRMKKIETDERKLIIDIEALKSGIYIIVVKDQSGFIWRQKIIKTIPE